jgi:hypothetical protein
LGLRVEATDFTNTYTKKELFNAFANNSFDMVAATFEKLEKFESRFEYTSPIYYVCFFGFFLRWEIWVLLE